MNDIQNLVLPKKLSERGVEEQVKQYLLGRPSINTGEREITLPVIEPEEMVKEAIRREFLRRHLIIGLESIGQFLKKEERGLKNKGQRVSRLLVTSRDGARRFYREVGRLITLHQPRLMGLMLNTDSSTMGSICGRKYNRPVKAILINHKDGVAYILGALISAKI